MLNNLTGTPQYLSWLARKLRPHLGDTVLEVGAGIGNLTGRLMARRVLYVAAEKDPLHLHALRNRFLRTPNVVVQRIDPDSAGGPGRPGELLRYGALHQSCSNTWTIPRAVLESLRATLKPQGVIVVLAPQGPGLFGSLDRTARAQTPLSPRRMLRETAGIARASRSKSCGSSIKAGAPPWWAYSKVTGSTKHQQAGAEDFR